MKSDTPKYSLIEHLQELRWRLIKFLIFIGLGMIIGYGLSDSILSILIKPAGRLFFIAPHEAFLTKLKTALLSGLILSSPFTLYQIWGFIASGLNPTERKYIKIFGPASLILFILGIIFSFYIVVPISLNFLLSYANENIIPMITINKYISFLGTLILAFGLMFELPLCTLFLTKINVITPQFLISNRRYAVVLIFIFSAFLTPPDIFTQCLLAGPLLILYEGGIIFSKMAYNKSRVKQH